MSYQEKWQLLVCLTAHICAKQAKNEQVSHQGKSAKRANISFEVYGSLHQCRIGLTLDKCLIRRNGSTWFLFGSRPKCLIKRRVEKNITQFVGVCDSLHQRRTGLNWTSGLSGGVAAHDLFGWVWQLQQQIDNPSHKQSFHTIPLTRLFMPISTRDEYSHAHYFLNFILYKHTQRTGYAQFSSW